MTTAFPWELLTLLVWLPEYQYLYFAVLIEYLEFLRPGRPILNYLPFHVICPPQTQVHKQMPLQKGLQADLFLSSLGEVLSAALHLEANGK